MAKTKTKKANYDHFEKKGLKTGDLVKLIAEVNGMKPGGKGEIVDKKVMADGGAHHVKILVGPKHGTTHYILARDLELVMSGEKLKELDEDENPVYTPAKKRAVLAS